MLLVNFKAYGNYVTDSLYQWDINQELVIQGLPVSEAPEIHYANADMERAIPRLATYENGVIKCDIPNSLLQSALTIKAYVGVYEGEKFKTIETIEIPVIARSKPYDYVLEDTDEELYSFRHLEARMDDAIGEVMDYYNETRDMISEGYDEAIAEIEKNALKDIAVPLLLTDWVLSEDGNTYSQTVTVEGLSETNNPMVMLSAVGAQATEDELNSYACISDINVIENGIIFIASELPTISFTVIVKSAMLSDSAIVSDVTALVGKISELETELEELNSDLEWKVKAVNLPITGSFKYVLPDEIKNANEVMLRVGIDTLNKSKKYQHIFIGDVASFDYFGDATYNYSYALYRSADSIIYHDGSVNGWADGGVSLLAIHYR